MVQKIKENKHSKFVEYMIEKASKQDSTPRPHNHGGIDQKEIEKLSREIRDKGSARKQKEKTGF
ncbi:MAG: hypothetical protein KKG60_03250 [Nanoarchaeota archaeon]|nr:hypothetical protein [Nanoarchaeota archaeon]